MQIVNGQYVEGFYIYSIKVESNGVYKMLTVLHGGGASSCTITQLEKNTLYNFFLIPFYKSIEGKPSNMKQSSTGEDGEIYLKVTTHSPRILSKFHIKNSAKLSANEHGSFSTQHIGRLS